MGFRGWLGLPPKGWSFMWPPSLAEGTLTVWTLSYRLGPLSRYRFHQISAGGYAAGVKWSRGKQPPGF